MRVPLFGLGLAGKSKAVTAKRLENLYCEIRPAGEKSQVVAYGTPGLELFADIGGNLIRGARVVGDLIYVVYAGSLYEVNNAGTATNRGALSTTTGRVDITDNGTQLLIVDGTSWYVYTIATTTLSTAPDADMFSNPVTCAFQDGHGIVTFEDSGRFQLTSAYAFQTVDATDYANAESSPDSVVRVVADHGEIVLFGDVTTEFWGNTGAADFPYAVIRGATTEWGLAARWSVAKYDNSLAFLGKNRMGQVQVIRLQGYQAVPISTPDLDNIINGYDSVADATGLAYMWSGHPMYQINFPTEGASWLYDGSTKMWSALSSDGGRHYGEIGFDFLNKPRVTDYSQGRIYTLSDTTYTDNGAPIVREIVSENVRAPDGERFAVDCVRVDCEMGVGIEAGQGSDPQMMLQVSRDSGKTWGAELWRDMGAMGVNRGRVEWRRLGTTDQVNFKLRVTDPVKVVISSASMNPND